jgi:outer membrane protein TolC
MKKFFYLSLISFNVVAAPLDFNQALEEIKKKNTKTEVAEKEAEYLNAERLAAYAQFLPSASLSAYRTKDYRPEDKSQVDSFYLNSSLNLFRFGADFYNIKAAHRNRDLGEGKRQKSYLSVESEGFNALTEYIFNEQNLKILEDSLKIKEDYYQTAKLRSARALITEQEVTKILIDLSNLRSQREDTYLLFLKAQGNVLALLEEQQLNLTWPLHNFFMKLEENKFKNSQFDWQESLDYKITSNESLREEAKLTKSKLVFLPTVDLSFSTGYDKFKEIGKKDYDTRTVLSLTIPLFENLNDYSSYKAQVHNYYQSLYALRQLSRDLKEELNEKKAGLLVAVKSAKEREEILKMARKLYQTSLSFFNQGRISVDTLQRDQERLLESEYLSQKAWLTAHQSFKDFCHLLGRDLNSCILLF